MEAREHIRLIGRVQGVGMRPFVARLARDLGLGGWVRNDGAGVTVVVAGSTEGVETFLRRVIREAPPSARIERWNHRSLPPRRERAFSIFPSDEQAGPRGEVAADLAPCARCLEELFDPGDRRYRYPFLSCTQCGPRDSIVQDLPFDRSRTTLAPFELCLLCRREYEDPGDRRFHAQTVACPRCGPTLQLQDAEGIPLAVGDDSLRLAVDRLHRGRTLALQGVGGFQLLADARNTEAVEAVRRIKARPRKPLAVLAASLEEAAEWAEISPAEGRLLADAAAPLVLLRYRGGLADNLAPGLDTVAIGLPASPLHHLIARDFAGPLVLTSGNVSDEPLALSAPEARARLCGCEDFLSHDRAIARPLDDSLAEVAAGRPRLLRRARGYSAEPLRAEVRGGVLAFGSHLKNTVALSTPGRIWVSPHVGDMDCPRVRDRCAEEASLLERRTGIEVHSIACDGHPDYGSTALAEERHKTLHRVYHHEAHVRACAVEYGLREPFLAFAWDGFGLGEAGALWGGEVFVSGPGGALQRVASLRPFRIAPGAAREPWRSAISFLSAIYREVPLPAEAETVMALRLWLENGQAMESTSVGRLFDAVGALLLGRGRSEYEGQTARELEGLARQGRPGTTLPLPWTGESFPSLDWEPLFHDLLDLRGRGVPPADLALAFHEALARAIGQLAVQREQETVCLTGGVFQNRWLLERSAEILSGSGIRVLWPQRFPPNDGGISLGQVAAGEQRREHVPRNSR